MLFPELLYVLALLSGMNTTAGSYALQGEQERMFRWFSALCVKSADTEHAFSSFPCGMAPFFCALHHRVHSQAPFCPEIRRSWQDCERQEPSSLVKRTLCVLAYRRSSRLQARHSLWRTFLTSITAILSSDRHLKSEWAHFRGNDIASGWSARGGQNTNPYYPGADPCGSSSGSGTAAAIGLATVALGTETDGSLICPASYQNVVGIKPTVGLTSRTGGEWSTASHRAVCSDVGKEKKRLNALRRGLSSAILASSSVIPISSHQDSIGPMARSVSDAAHVLSVIAGRDYSRGGNNYTLAQPAHVPNYVSALRTDALQGKRLGIPRKVFLDKDTNALQQSVIDAFEESVKTLEELGATVVDNADFEDPEEIVANNGVGEVCGSGDTVGLGLF